MTSDRHSRRWIWLGAWGLSGFAAAAMFITGAGGWYLPLLVAAGVGAVSAAAARIGG